MGIVSLIWNILYTIISSLVSFVWPQKQLWTPTVAVVGAGFSGLSAAIKLQKKFGIQPKIFEVQKELGGVWQANNYPGCGCDVLSHLYSFSFELNPDWSQACGGQPEILEYMRKVAHKYKIYDQISFNTQVTRATWLEDVKKWKLDYQSNQSKLKTEYFDILITGLGSSRKVRIPQEYKDFKGPIVHTAEWDKSINFKGKRVAVVGNGSSAIQLIPELQKIVSKLINYQRSPCWILNKPEFAYPFWMRKLFAMLPILMQIHRFLIFALYELYFPMLIKNFKTSRAVNWSNNFFRKDMVKQLESEGRQDLISVLVPQHPLGCKRIGFSADFLKVMTKDNIEIKQGKIKNIKGQTIFHEDGTKVDVDILVLATGFDAQSFLGKLEIVGKHGICLNDKWDVEYPAAYKSLHVHGFPNLFLLLGPNYCAQNNVIGIINVLTDSTMRTIGHMMKNNVDAIEVKKEAQDKDVSALRENLKTTAWAGNCTSYYKNEKEQITIMFPGSLTQFWWHLRHENYSRDFLQSFK